ncbi:MAG: LPS export ABC transporter permease LptG [Rhodocyclaceae bacterium]|nr:LPS export ABC transporter permease LptG [Rhodocyclaceae bacterium]MBX3667438.1 LPS export ABC transporter permease LptG [Rhodocyclaceae bacterium]
MRAAILLVLVAFLGLFSFFDLVHELEDLGRGGYQLQHAALFVLLKLPGRAYELLPIVVLIGSLYAFTMLARHSEITVLRASGLSTRQLLGLLARQGLWYALATFLIGEFAAPPAEDAARLLKLHYTADVVAQEFRSGVWMKDGSRFINVRSVLPDGSLGGIRMFLFDADRQLTSIQEAKAATFVPPDTWRLQDVVQTEFTGRATRVSKLDMVPWRTELTPGILSVGLAVPERMSVYSLYVFSRHLEENRQKSDRYVIALWKKLVYPLAVFVMLALALPFAYMHDRMGAVSVKVFVGIMIGILFHMLNGLFSNLGIINSWPAPVAALTPSLLFLATAWSMMWWVERR